MSCSSTTSKGNGSGLKFQRRNCFCHKPAIIRITKSDEYGNQDKIYYSCEARKCGLWDWCEPVNQINSSLNNGEHELMLNKIELIVQQNAMLVDRMKLIEGIVIRDASKSYSGIAIVMSTIAIVLSLLIILLK